MPCGAFEAVVRDMVIQDLDTARRRKLLASHGYEVALLLD
jgi:GDPmannose 4,6-dehydratase